MRIQTDFVKPGANSAEEINLSKANKIAWYVFRTLGFEKRYMSLKSSKGELIRAKRISIYLISVYCELIDDHMAEMFNVDRSTIVYHRKTCNDLLFSDKPLSNLINKFIQDLGLRERRKTA